MKTARVLLLWPGSAWAGEHVRRHVPVKLPLLALFSYLRHHRVEVDVLDLHTELGRPQPDHDAVAAYYRQGLELLEARTFDVLAISCWTSFDYIATWEFARQVRERDSGVLIVVGGYHPTAVPDDFTGPGSPFDAVVRGEGETVLLDIARHGLERSSRVPILDGHPFPMDEPYVDLESFPYLEPRPFKLDVALSRGCPHHCTFCAGPAEGRSWRAYPVPVALAVARSALALRPRMLDILDPCFGSRPSWRRDFLAGLAATDPDAVISVQTRADSVTAADLAIMRRMDFYLQLGVETMSPAMAERMGKSRDGERYVRKVQRVLEDANERNVLTLANILVNHPGETPATLEATVDYLERFVQRHHTLSLGVAAALYDYLPGSDVAMRRSHYERQYGTRIASPAWWRAAEPQKELVRDVRASASLADVGPWYDRLLSLRLQAIERWSAGAKLTAYRRRMPLAAESQKSSPPSSARGSH